MKQQSFLTSIVLLGFGYSLHAQLGIRAYVRALAYGHSEVSLLRQNPVDCRELLKYQWYSKPIMSTPLISTSEGQPGTNQSSAAFYEGHPYVYNLGERKKLYAFIQSLPTIKGIIIPCSLWYGKNVSQSYWSKCKTVSTKELRKKLLPLCTIALLLCYAISPNSNPDQTTYDALATDLTKQELEAIRTNPTKSHREYLQLQNAFVKIINTRLIIWDTQKGSPAEDGSSITNGRRYKIMSTTCAQQGSVTHNTDCKSPWEMIYELQSCKDWFL